MLLKFHQSMLRMEAHYTSKERKQRVEEIMIEVGILQDWDGVLNQNNILRTKKDNIYELLQVKAMAKDSSDAQLFG